MEPQVVKKKVRVHSLEPHDEELALVINYVKEVTVQHPDGQMELQETPGSKGIVLGDLTPHDDPETVAAEIIQSSKLLHPSMIEDIGAIIVHLQERLLEEDSAGMEDYDRMAQMALHDQEQAEIADSIQAQQMAMLQQQIDSTLESLDSYIEMLYEDNVQEKVKGTYMILQLARNADNLETLIQDERLFSRLVGTLKESAKQSLDLSINIMYIFLCFSSFSEFHQMIVEHEVGSLTFKVLDYELKRFVAFQKELDSVKSADAETAKKEAKKTKLKIQLQDKLIHAALYFLLNLAEDISIEKKMRKKGIVGMMVQLIEKRSSEVALAALTFLKKLSIFKENKEEMKAAGIVEKSAKFFESSADALVLVTMRLFLNLSFDADMRQEMIQQNIVPKLVDALRKEPFRLVVLRLLYHLSTDDRCKSTFSYTEAPPMVYKLVVKSHETRLEKTLAALAVNLAMNQRCAERFLGESGLKPLMERLLRSRDPLLAKMIRNCASHDMASKEQFREYVPDLVTLLKGCEAEDNVDLLVEVLGTLGSLNMSSIPFAHLLVDYDLVSLLQRLLVPGFAEDDVVLEVVVFIGTCAQDPETAKVFASSSLVHALHDVMADKQDDDEIVLQIVFCYHYFIQHECTRDVLVGQTEAVSYLCELLYDRNEQISKLADQVLDVVVEMFPELGEQIKLRKFQVHNAEWLRACEEDGGEGAFEDAYDMPGHHDHEGGMSDFHWEDAANLGDGAMYWDDDDGQY